MQNKMSNLSGKEITSLSGRKFKLTEVVGSGSQGVVYKESSENYMVKMYYPTGDSLLDKEAIEKLSFVKKIKKPRNFVEIHDIIDAPYVGYAMDRVVGYSPLNEYLIPDVNAQFGEWYNKNSGLLGRLFLGYIIAKAFRELSESNLSYCDISGNNIMVKMTEKGPSVRMIDIDNIYVAGRGSATVLGTPRYIAPEIIKKTSMPNVFSDNYSLAVILFELLRVGHPYISDDILDGTPEQEEAAFEGKANYVNDDNSTFMLPTNVVFTQKLNELFEKCFVDGKDNRISRPSAKEFECALLEASNNVIRCPNCGAWHYPAKIGKDYKPCPWCGGESKPKAFIKFYDRFYEEKTNGSEVAGTSIPDPDQDKPLYGCMLRDGKNLIKTYYIARRDEVQTDIESNYITIVKVNDKFHLYNEFDKADIRILQFASKKYQNVVNKGDVELKAGDEISFGKTSTITCSGKTYRFERIAKFVEDNK